MEQRLKDTYHSILRNIINYENKNSMNQSSGGGRRRNNKKKIT